MAVAMREPRMSHEEIIAFYKQDAGALAQKCKNDIPTRLTQEERAGRIAALLRGEIRSLDEEPLQHPTTHDAIIAAYKNNESELGRKYKYDASAREERMERATRGAAYMRGDVGTLDPPPQRSQKSITYTASAHRCVTHCSRCGSENTHTQNGKTYCFSCRSIDGVKVSRPTASKASLLCPKCKGTNFFISPKSGDMHCYECRKDSRGVGPKGISRYTHFCVCGSGQVDVSATHVICRKCGKRAKRGL